MGLGDLKPLPGADAQTKTHVENKIKRRNCTGENNQGKAPEKSADRRDEKSTNSRIGH